MFDVIQNRLLVEGTLIAQTATRIGTGRVAAPVGTELPVLRDASRRPFVPGSSLKGSLRSQVEALLRGWCDSPYCACNPVDEKEQCIQSGRVHSKSDGWEYPADGRVPAKPIGIEDLRHGLAQLPAKDRDREFTRRVEANTCLACRTFGSPWLASHVRVRDLPVDPTQWVGQFEIRDGVAIDRDKGTAADGWLYNYEVVPAGTRFTLHIVGENLEDWQRGLLWLGIRALKREDVALGGFTSRGLGWIKLVDWQARLVEQDALIKLLAGGPVAGRPVNEEEAKDWVRALRARVQEQEAHNAQAVTE